MKKLEGLRVTYAQAVHGVEEEEKVLAVLRQHRTILGKETEEFEHRVARKFGKKFGIMVNSGSSALTIAVELMNLEPGSEVITPILTFSTTVASLLRNNLIPVFVDVERGKYTIDVSQVEKLITKKTKALMIPLLLGNVPDMIKLSKLSKKFDIYLIEDSCDTLGATIGGKPTGHFADMSITSFYGSHIITAGGGGGMLMINSETFRDRAKLLRGWGRSSSRLNESESFDKRFGQKLNNIPYDSKFIFDAIGHNFLPIEMSAAFGNAQLTKLSLFKKIRNHNFKYLLRYFKNYEDYFLLPRQDSNVITQWLAFPLTIKPSAPFTRLQLVKYLEEKNIQTRPIFTGNILYHPGFKSMRHKKNGLYEVTEEIMQRGFLIGCHHGLTEKHLQKITEVFAAFLKQVKKPKKSFKD